MMELEIKELDIREMHWDGVDDWSRLCPSKISVMETEYVSKEDIFRFYDFIVREVARKYSQEYKKVSQIMDAENQPFIEYVNQIFQKKKLYRKDDPQIRKIKLLLISPQDYKSTRKCMVRWYNSLPDEEKQKFRRQIGIE